MVPDAATKLDILAKTDTGNYLSSAACMEYLLFIFLVSHVSDSKNSRKADQREVLSCVKYFSIVSIRDYFYFFIYFSYRKLSAW